MLNMRCGVDRSSAGSWVCARRWRPAGRSRSWFGSYDARAAPHGDL